MNTTGEGFAACSCGAELHVVCSSGCAEPDVVFKSERAAIRKPTHRGEPKQRKYRPGLCTWEGCDDAIAPRAPGARGQPWTKCPKHLAKSREYSANRKKTPVAI